MRRLRVRGLVSRASGGLGRHRPAQLHGSVRQRAGGADESGGNPVGSRAFEWAPLSVSRRRSRGLRKTPQWSAERRAGPRYGSAVPSRWRVTSDRKTGQRVRRSAPANFGAPLPSFGTAKGSKPTIWHDSPPGCAARQRSRTAQQLTEKSTMLKFAHPTLHRHARPQPSEGRRRHSRLKDGVASLAYGSPMCRASTPWRQSKAWMAGTSPAMTNDGLWRNEPENSFWRNEPET